MTTLNATQIARLEDFLERVRGETYPEPPSTLHTQLTERMFQHLIQDHPLPRGSRVLDVGCGQGTALELFRRHGLQATGITLNELDVEVCQRQGFDVRAMDQSFLEFDDESFDLLWCRHCLEHSIFPYFTLSEFRRVLAPEGLLYVEVPAPDTACQHQTNANHYSVLGKSMWIELFRRSGFDADQVVDIGFTPKPGPDQYWAFTMKRLP